MSDIKSSGREFRFLYIALAVLCLIIGVFFGRRSVSCPEVIVGEETTIVTVTVRDTVLVEKEAEKIVIERPVVERVYVDSSTGDEKVVEDTTVCYSFDQKMDDSAYVKCEMCSDSLPIDAVDLSGSITYLPPPDTLREVFRIDTVQFTKKPEGTWRRLAVVAGVSFLSGMVVSNLRD